jgi:F420-dependent oxidoreductase-like protein
MRIGVMNAAAGGTVDSIVAEVKSAEAEGFASYWLPHIFGLDAITALAIAGRESSSIELGTAVVPTYPRHPVAIAQQALTASAASGGRFTLGIGLSHKLVIEDMFGLSYDKPARHMREYLEVLGPLLHGEPAKHEGELYRVNVGLSIQDAQPTALLVAALGPVMLRHTARLADGTITWMTGPKTLAEHIVPTLGEAASKAGRPKPRVVAGLPVALTRDEDAARAVIDKAFAMYPTLPSYKAMLEREGPNSMPADISLVGDEATLRDKIQALGASGVTDLIAAVVFVEPDDTQATRSFLASL